MKELDKEIQQSENNLYKDVCGIIDGTRRRVATYLNAETIMMNYGVGKRIKEDVLYNRRAEYGKQVIKNLSKRLTDRYGSGWGLSKLQHCVRVSYTFSDEQIVYACRTQLNWSHIRALMGIQDSIKRDFYIEMSRLNHWTAEELEAKIDRQLYETTALSRKPDDVIKKELETVRETNNIVPDMVFRSDYVLDMMGLPDIYSENDLENAILNQIQEFMKELGPDFTFVDRQKKLIVDQTIYRIDLLFFHRGMRRLIAIDLKLGKFKPEHEGQMLLYLRYLNQNERKPWEESPIGLILCSEGNTEHIEYLMLDDNSPIKVAQYHTELPDKKLLAQKLQKAIAIAKEHCKVK